MNYCEKCGNKLLSSDKFCENCGEKVEIREEAKQIQEPNVPEVKTPYVNPPEQQAYTHSQPQVPVYGVPKKKSKAVFFIVGGILLAVFIIILIAGTAGYFLILKKTDSVKEPVTENVKKETEKKESKSPAADDEKKVTKKEGFQKREKRDGDCGDYPELSERKIDSAELTGVSAKEKKYMKNDIYMRHGYIFTDEELLLHYAMFSCYEPKYLSVVRYLTNIEKYNIKLLEE